MKTTGIMRRIDDLGRIVIPKEIRKNLKIKTGDNLEIYLSDDNILLKKYSPIESIESVAQKYVEAFNQVIKSNIIITDRNKVIAVSGEYKKKYLGMSISTFLENTIERRYDIIVHEKKAVELIEDIKEYFYYAISPIINNGDSIGSVIVFSSNNVLSEVEEKIPDILSQILIKYFVN